MAYRIEKLGYYFVVTDTSTGDEIIREVRDTVKWVKTQTDGYYQFLFKAPTSSSFPESRKMFILGAEYQIMSYDFSTIVDLNDNPFADEATFEQFLNVTTGFIPESEVLQITDLNSTVTGGTGASINALDNTKFDFNIQGRIVNPDTFEITEINLDLEAQDVTNIAGSQYTWLAVNSSGAVEQQTTLYTNEQLKDRLGEWILVHSNLTNLNAINNFPERGTSLSNQLHAYMRNRGMQSITGNEVSSNGANLKIDVSSGVLERVGIDPNNNGNPNELSVAALTAASFRMRNQNTVEDADTTDIDTANYDVSGVTTDIPSGSGSQFGIWRPYKFSSNLIRIQRPQFLYSSMEEALANITIDNSNFIENQNIAENAVLIGYIIIKRDATDLSDPDQAMFLHPEVVATGGASIVPTWQNVYDVSSQPQVVINDTKGVVQFKNNRSDQSDTTQEWLNSSDVAVASVNGDGLLEAISLGIIGEYALPTTDGTSGQAMVTNGAGVVSWVSISADNIYTANGTLSGNRVVTMSGNTLAFNGGNVGIGAAPSASVRLDVRMQGALSTDIGFRVRNSADTLNTFQVRGDNSVLYDSACYVGHGNISSNIQHFISGSFLYGMYIDGTRTLAHLNIAKNNTTPRGINISQIASGVGLFVDTTNAVNANRWGVRIDMTGTNGSTNTGLLINVANGGVNQAIDLVAGDIWFSTSGAGTKIGAASTHKFAFWGKTPIVQPTTAITGATLVSNSGTAITDTDTFGGYTLQQLAAIIINTGLGA